MENVLKLFSYLGIGVILSTFLTILYNWLSLRRQFRQALDQKMIDRISHLVEKYYAQISSSSESLRNALNQTLWSIRQKEKTERQIQISFYYLLSCVYYCNRLTQERPRPLFTEIEAEMDYKQRIFEVYDGLPYNIFDISLLIKRCQTNEGFLPAHEFVKLLEGDKELRLYYQIFSQWIYKCKCSDEEEKSCDVHKVIYACYWICSILEDQMHKMYRIWYDRQIKIPKKRKRRKKLAVWPGRLKRIF